MRAVVHRHFSLPQSSSTSRFTAGAAGFLNLSQSASAAVSRAEPLRGDTPSSAAPLTRWNLLTLAGSSFRQIRNCSCKIGVVDQLETAIAAALTGLCVGSVFRVRDKRLGCFPRWKLQKCNKGGIQRLAFQRLHVPAACQVLAAMLVYNVVHRSRVWRHPPIVSYLYVCDHVNSHCPYLL